MTQVNSIMTQVNSNLTQVNSNMTQVNSSTKAAWRLTIGCLGQAVASLLLDYSQA